MTAEPTPQVIVTPLDYDDAVLATLDLPAGRLVVTRGLGSGLATRRGDPPGTVWAIGDRGPNLKVKFAIKRYGLQHLDQFTEVDGAKVMPFLDVGPAISELRVEGDRVVHVGTLPLRATDGTPISGLPIPGDFSEPALNLDGGSLAPAPGGADTEGIVALADGTFWVAEEYGPSLFHVAADGHVIERWVPEGLAHPFAGAGYPVVEVLPAIAARRQLNRGFEGLTLSPDEASLYLAFQSPLAHPDEGAYRRGRHVRIWRLDLAARSVTGQYLYPLDPPDSFARDCAKGKVRRSDIKVGELVMLTDGRLLVLERGSETTKLYVVEPRPENLLDSAHLDAATMPTLELLSAAADLGDGIVPLAKTLVLTTDDHLEVAPDIEGIAALADGTLLIVNDNDFGVDGVTTRFWRIDFLSA